MSDELQRLAIFQDKQVRKTLHLGEWWFVIVDVVAVLTDSADPSQYLKRLRQRDDELSQLFDPVDKGGGTNCTPPYSILSDRRGKTAAIVLEYRGPLPADSVHTLTKGRAI